jgi:hypothetical protein
VVAPRNRVRKLSLTNNPHFDIQTAIFSRNNVHSFPCFTTLLPEHGITQFDVVIHHPTTIPTIIILRSSNSNGNGITNTNGLFPFRITFTPTTLATNV